VLARRSRRPKKNASPTTIGTMASVVVVSAGWVNVSKHDAADEEQHLARQLGDPGAEQRLEHREVRRQTALSSPVRRSVKKPGDSRTRCATTSSRSFAITRSEVPVSR
jgi:hypothetical protein